MKNSRKWWSIFSTPGYKDLNKSLTDITVKTIEENARKWLNIVRFTESGTVIQLQDDCEYSITEIINNKYILKKYLGPYFRKYLLKYIPIDQKDLLKAIHEALIDLCLKSKIGSIKTLSGFTDIELLNLIAERGYEVGLFISHITPILTSKKYQSLIDLELLVQTSKNLSVIVFSELDVTNENYKILADKCSFLYDHVIFYPLYSEPDTLQFIKFYSDLWDFSLQEKAAKEIYQLCGGYFWLIHQAIRNLRDYPKLSVNEAYNDNLMLNKLEIIWAKFTNEEKNILRKIYFKSLQITDSTSHEYEYLKRIRVIKEINSKAELGIPILLKVIEKELKLESIHIRDKGIWIGKNNITESLSPKEQMIMFLLLNSKNKIVPRNAIAQTIWGENWEEKYSDWAIDVLAHRIRKKLKLIGIDKTLLRTVKKKGFIFG